MTDAQKWLIVAVAAGFGWLVYLLAPILTPFAISGLLAYLGDPLADRLEKGRLNRTSAVVIVFACMLLGFSVLLLIIVPLLENLLLCHSHPMPHGRPFEKGLMRNALDQRLRDVKG